MSLNRLEIYFVQAVFLVYFLDDHRSKETSIPVEETSVFDCSPNQETGNQNILLQVLSTQLIQIIIDETS